MIPFNVISNRSGQRRTVYAVSFHELPYFLIFRDGKWIWEESRWYKPVNVAPPVHGRWLDICEDMGLLKCNLCGSVNHDRYHYCPNCGAKMNKEVNADAQMSP